VTFPVRLNPMRAHGAWVYLFAAIGSGTVVGADHGVEIPLLVGTGFIGGFQVMAGIAIGLRQKQRQILIGLLWATVTSLAALWLGANPPFLAIALLAILPGTATILYEQRRGWLATETLVVGVTALAFAAPVVAVAGGTSVARGALLFGLLWPFFFWRTLRIARRLAKDPVWIPEELKRQGLREAVHAALWAIAVGVTLRVIFATAL